MRKLDIKSRVILGKAGCSLSGGSRTQIEEKDYAARLREEGMGTVPACGIACLRKIQGGAEKRSGRGSEKCSGKILNIKKVLWRGHIVSTLFFMMKMEDFWKKEVMKKERSDMWKHLFPGKYETAASYENWPEGFNRDKKDKIRCSYDQYVVRINGSAYKVVVFP